MFYGKMLAGTPNETGGIGLFQYNVMMQPGFHLDSMWLCPLRESIKVHEYARGTALVFKCAVQRLLCRKKYCEF